MPLRIDQKNPSYKNKHQNLRVKSVSSILHEKRTVYNFEVKKMHSYFVGENLIWVHNSSRVPSDNFSEKAIPKFIEPSEEITKPDGYKVQNLPKNENDPFSYIYDGTTKLTRPSVVRSDDKNIFTITVGAYDHISKSSIGSLNAHFNLKTGDLNITGINIERSYRKELRKFGKDGRSHPETKIVAAKNLGPIGTHLVARALDSARAKGVVKSMSAFLAGDNRRDITESRIPPLAYSAFELGFGSSIYNVSTGFIEIMPSSQELSSPEFNLTE